MDSLNPPLDGDRDRGPIIIAIICATCGLACLTLSLRFYSRVHIRAVGWDDWMMLLCVILTVVLTVLETILCLRGGCRHLYYLLLEANGRGYLPVTEMMHLAEPFSFMALAAGRISVALLLLRIITTSVWRRWFLYACIAITIIANLVWCVCWFTKCPPDPGLSPPYQAGLCWNPATMFGISIFTAVWNVVMDFALAILPITVFWKLQLNTRKRIGLSCFMGLGVFAAVSGAIKTAKLDGINGVDFTWDQFELYFWAILENFLIVFCGSAPTLKPVYDKAFKSSHTLKEAYRAYLRKHSARSGVSDPSMVESGHQNMGFHELQEALPVHGILNTRRAENPREVDLWSTQGSVAGTIPWNMDGR